MEQSKEERQTQLGITSQCGCFHVHVNSNKSNKSNKTRSKELKEEGKAKP